ncbi:hypothetical protein C8Q70DRAFT_1056432 [Cubamyces menziesii]|uniref:Pyridoxamine 5'-phosphate oxidase putative domain-containing protein n=1 Tax=Trametes cubensis TaxID=1111947 RepID=A0AAD7U1S2_9APHY|nr:hypothetical protein C8Q70DRAFT_1056432 [Cubamyces menziesii]KAJ8495171.1 hypothetical protein ONZ51_g1855 [Trametes cubensis]
MVKFYDHIPPDLIKWLLKQEMFCVATAPLSPDGHVNLSPKGLKGSFHIISPNRVWYQDITGSGVETISHLRENGRITLMFNAFEGAPRICRLWGIGTVHEFGTPEYETFIPPEIRRPGSRAAIVIDVHKVSTSCGYSVPYYEFKGHRQALLAYYDKRERKDREDPNLHADKGLRAYWIDENLQSIDGLPGLAVAHKSGLTPDCRDEMRDANTPEDVNALSEEQRGSGKTANGHGNGNGVVKANGNGNGVVKANGNGVANGHGKTANGHGSLPANGSGVLALVKHAPPRQRVQDFLLAFALGLAAAAIYVQVMSVL